MKIVTLAIIFLAWAPFGVFSNSQAKEEVMSEEDVSPNEDLMREHGVLNRLLLIYQEIARRIDNHESFPIHTLADAVKIVRSFLENYHEKLEEEYVFPKFEKANQHVELVRILKDQHQAGRNLTDYILAHSTEAELKDDIQRMILADYMRLYIRMFRPHEAREDTILFPAFRKLLSKDEYMKLGEMFEEKEHEFFGKDGFEKIVGQIENIEKELNIYNLSEFTPQLIEKSG